MNIYRIQKQTYACTFTSIKIKDLNIKRSADAGRKVEKETS